MASSTFQDLTEENLAPLLEPTPTLTLSEVTAIEDVSISPDTILNPNINCKYYDLDWSHLPYFQIPYETCLKGDRSFIWQHGWCIQQ